MNRTIHRRLPVVTAFAATTMLAANLAIAAWTTNGAGTGTAIAGSHVSLGTVTATAVDPLFPQNSAKVRVTIKNDNPYKVEVTKIHRPTGSAAFTVDAGHSTCNVGSLSFTDKIGSWVVPANGQLNVELASAISMDNSALDACKGAVFTIPVTLDGVSTDLAPSTNAWTAS